MLASPVGRLLPGITVRPVYQRTVSPVIRLLNKQSSAVFILYCGITVDTVDKHAVFIQKLFLGHGGSVSIGVLDSRIAFIGRNGHISLRIHICPGTDFIAVMRIRSNPDIEIDGQIRKSTDRNQEKQQKHEQFFHFSQLPTAICLIYLAINPDRAILLRENIILPNYSGFRNTFPEQKLLIRDQKIHRALDLRFFRHSLESFIPDC